MSMPTTLSECTAAVAGAIATDCTAVVEVLDQLIADGGADTSTCILLRRTVQAMGYLADAVQQAHGNCPGAVGGAEEWLLLNTPKVHEAVLLLAQKRGAA